MWEFIRTLLGIDKKLDGKYYNYVLKDPRTYPAKIFYVGKGTGNRIHEHERETRKLLLTRETRMRMQHKHKYILEIWDAGLEVEHEIYFRTDDERHSYMVESATIEQIGIEHLTNRVYGLQPKKPRKSHPTVAKRRQIKRAG